MEGEFFANIAGVLGDSGGAATVDIAGHLYVVGITDGGPTHDAVDSRYAYLELHDYYFLMSAVQAGAAQTLASLPPNLILGHDSDEIIKGTARPEHIVTQGSNDLILAGPNGDMINTETGSNDVIFMPSAKGEHDAGTTYVLSPGNNTIVGGVPNDRLVLPADRLWDKSRGVPSSDSVSDVSPMITITGGEGDQTGLQYGFYSVSTESADVVSTNPIDYEIGNYDYFADFVFQPNGDLYIQFQSKDPTAEEGTPALWVGAVTLKNYHPGDFGLTFTNNTNFSDFLAGRISYAGYEQRDAAANIPYVSSPVQQTYVDDLASIDWNGGGLSDAASWKPSSLDNTTLTNDLDKIWTSTG